MLVLLCLSACVAPAVARPDPPTESIVWWRFDPTRFASVRDAEASGEAEAMRAMLRAVVGAGLVGDGLPAQIAQGLLAAAEIGAAPHTFAVIDFTARRNEENAGMVVEQLQAIVHVETRANHARMLRTIRAIAVDAAGPDAAADEESQAEPKARQRTLELPGRRTGVALRRDDWPAWRELAWCSHNDGFTIALGEGALERWFTVSAADDAPWTAHRDAVDNDRPAGAVILESWIDFEALRERFPGAFLAGRTPRMLDALDLDDARAAMLHGRFITQAAGPALLALALTTEPPRRAAGEEGLQRAPWTLDAWPKDLPRPPAEASYAMIARVDWPAFIAWAREVHDATINEERLASYRADVEAWNADHADDLASLLASLAPWLMVADDPTPVMPVPGLATFIAPLREGAEPGAAARAMQQTISDFTDRVESLATKGRARWRYRIDDRGLLKLPVWSLTTNTARPGITGGWGLPVLETGRAWLDAFEE